MTKRRIHNQFNYGKQVACLQMVTDVLQTSLFCKIQKNLYENTYDGVFANKVRGYRSTVSLKNNILSQMLSCEFWNIFQKRGLTEIEAEVFCKKRCS